MATRRMTVAQAVVEFLGKQYTVDNIGAESYRERLIPGMFGIFGHGNVAGVGQALKQWQVRDPALMPYYQGRNEQAQSHQAVGYARHTRRRATYAVSTSIGPGSSNLLTGAALATANRLPVLLLPSDTFATRAADPVLQQLEHSHGYDITVNDAFRPLSKYFDRVNRPEQLFSAMLHGLRVLTDPAETGAVTISLPQDVQAEVFEVPEEFLAERDWKIRRPEPEADDIARAAAMIKAAKSPLIIAGGGVLYSFAQDALLELAQKLASLSPTLRPVSELSLGTRHIRSVPLVPPVPPLPTRWPPRPIWSLVSGPATRISPPPHALLSRTPICASSTLTSHRWTPTSTAPRCLSSPMRARR